MKSLKILCGLVCLFLLASQIWSMSRWNETRGVYDDLCYLRQAHLFQRFGLSGFDTDLSRDDDRYFAAKLKEIGFTGTGPPPCHTPMPGSGKIVIQYPPGTGMLLALFPQGHQVTLLFASATIIIFAFALVAILLAGSAQAILSAAAFGLLAIYIMINPSKASYSMAPTMVVCALAGFLTARLLAGGQQRERIWLAMLLGLVLGVSVNFRLPNLFLSAGYFLFFLLAFLSSRKFAIALRGFCFGAAFVAGLAPTLIANAINAGSPFATTYGSVDAVAPEFSFAIISQYLGDMQFVLLLLAVLSIGYVFARRADGGVRRVALVTAANLVVNLAFFLSHPLFTPYYMIPIAVLSLWSVSFALLMRPAESANENLLGQAADARS
jgi:hypothetical protein